MRRVYSAASLLLSLAYASQAAGQIQPILTVASFGEYECFGAMVATAGDADGDGRPDLLVGERHSTASSVANTMFLVDGDDGEVITAYGLGDVVPTSDCALAQSRIVVGRDRNGDGIRDLLLGYPDVGVGGTALAISGADGSLQLTLFTTRISSGDDFGNGIAEFGSAIGSNEPDVVVGAPGEDGLGPSRGAMFVFDGVTGDTAHFGPLGRPDSSPQTGFGDQLMAVGDTDGDDREDFIVVQWGERPPGDGQSGHRVYLFSGAQPSFRFELYPSSTRPRGLAGRFGESAAGVPDLDGDGSGEILVGDVNALAETHSFSTGRAWLYSGASGALIDSLDIPAPAGNLSAFMGRSVAALGDVTGDGLSELVVGAPGYDSGSEHPTHPTATNNGRVFIYDGATRDLLYTLRSPNEAGQEDNAFFGTSVASAGDIDGDGRPELIVGAPMELPTAGPVPSGRVYVFSLPPVSPTQAGPRESTLRLSSPRPHPVRDRGAIDFELRQAGDVRLVLLDVLGREVAVLAEGRFAAGLHSAQVDALTVAPGPYVARLQSGDTSVSRRVTISR